MRRLDMAGAGFMGIRESTLFVAKQLGLDQAFRKRSTVYADKGIVPPWAAGDDGLRDQLLPGSAFSANQYIDVALGHAADGVVHPPHRLAAADQLAKRVSAAGLLSQSAAIDFRRSLLQPLAQNALHFRKIHWRDEAVTDTCLFELATSGFVVRPVNPSKTRCSSR